MKLTLKQIIAESRRIVRAVNTLQKRQSALEKLKTPYLIEQSIKSAKYHVGQRVEYKKSGHNVIYFGKIVLITGRRYNNSAQYHVERLDRKGRSLDFGNTVSEEEIVGVSH